MADQSGYSQNRCSSRERLTLTEYQTITAEFIRFFSGLDNNVLILDSICGDGFFLEILRNLGFESIYGIDTVVSDLQLARSKGLRVLEGSVYDLDLREKVDVVLLCNDLESMENPGMAIARVYDALKEDGILYLIAIAYDSDSEKRRGWFRRKKVEKKVKENVDSDQRVFSMSSLLWLLESHQFKIENTFKQPIFNLTEYRRYFKEKQSELVSIAARKKKSSKPSVEASKSVPVKKEVEQKQVDEQEKTDAPFFQTEPEEDSKDEKLTEEPALESEAKEEKKDGDDTV